MAWYKTGTVAVTNASTTVTGAGTNFVSGAQVGDGFLGPNELLYEITAISSATSLTIAPAYGGATASSQNYAIAPTQGLVASLASDVTDLITDYQSVVDNAGAGKFGDGSAASPAIRFTNDQDTGFFRDTANEIAFATAGVKRGEFSSSGIQLLDNQKFIAGTGSDLQIYSDGTKSYLIESGSGDLELRATDFVVKNADNTKIMASFNDGGTVQLRYDNDLKLATTSTGVDITGNATFADNGKAIFGAGSDLQIYHDGATSRIEDINGGNLILRSSADVRIDKYTGENMGVFNADGSVDLYYDNSKKLATTSTGVDITGTLTSDGLTVDGDAAVNSNNLDIIGTNPKLNLMESDTTDINAQIITTSGSMLIRTLTDSKTTAKTRMKIDHTTGDISFYEDTGTTPKFFWDASSESLSIGTTISSAIPLQVSADTGTGVASAFIRSTGTGNNGIVVDVTNTPSDYVADFRIGNTSKMRIDSSGNVGIGTSSPAATLDVNGSAYIRAGSILGLYNTDNTNQYQIYNGGSSGASIGQLVFTQGGVAERMRIDSSGNLLVGKTSSSLATDGIEAKANGSLFVTRSSATPVSFRRSTNDGSIVNFYKDSTTVGSIGAAGGDIFVGTGDTTLKFADGADLIAPTGTNGTTRDGIISLGNGSNRFDDIFATNGTIQTSDANEKQDIEELSEAETRVAQACKGLLRKFRWQDAVAEKGDDARIHFGIIAQDLQDAFTAEGLDAGRYAMFISSTWTDEDTGEERTRMGVRYSELLAFIIAAI